MFWRMAGLSTASPVATILDKENFTLEELLDEDEIIQECKALNGRLISFLRERAQIEQLARYIVEEAPEGAEKTRTFKFPFISCEIFTCEVDVILKALVEDEELMDMLFSFLEPERSHSTLLAGYFSKVVVCLLLRKTVALMNYIRAHQDIIGKLVDLIGITSIMEVLIRLIGADEHLYANYTDAMQWLEETDVLEMIVDKFSSSDSPEVHANAAEALCAITRFAPPGMISKISSPSFVGRLFHHVLEDSRPKSVLVNSLSVCISLLDPKRLTSGAYYAYNRQMILGSRVTVNAETVDGMLKSLGDLLKLLDVSSEDYVLLTTYGKLHPPLGKHRLKIIEFISVLVTVSSEPAEKELIRLGAVKKIVGLFFEYPYNNFLHHHVEQIIVSCLESKNPLFVEHILHDCNLINKFLEAEKDFILATAPDKPTVPAEGKSPPRIGNIGHVTRIANKLVQLGNSNSDIQSHLQENNEWVDWHTNILQKRNAVENVFQWACGRPTAQQDRTRDSDDEDYQDRDYDVAALANNLSQAFRYGIYSNDENDEAQGSLERDDEDVYFDDESAEVVISSLRLGDDQESGSLFTNSNWFAFEDDNTVNERSSSAIASPSSKIEETDGSRNIFYGNNDLADTATSELSEEKLSSDDPAVEDLSKDSGQSDREFDKPPEWVEWRGSSDLGESSDPTSDPGLTSDDTVHPLSLPNGGAQVESESLIDEKSPNLADSSPPNADKSGNVVESDVVESQESADVDHSSSSSPVLESQAENTSSSSHSANSVDEEKPPIVTQVSGASEGKE